MNKIAIIGVQGSGKSTFANKLGKRLKREVIHLDKEFYLPNWERKYTKDEWNKFQKNIVKKEQWIIDGNYKSTLALRLDAADTIIFFNFSKLRCIYQAIKRTRNKEQPFDKPEGMKEKVNLQFLLLIASYNKNQVKQTLDEYKNRQIFIVRNHKESKKLLDTLTKE